MKRIARGFIIAATATAFSLSTGCASTMMVGQYESEEFYDEHPVAGVIVAPLDLALGIPLHILSFLVANPDMTNAILAGATGDGTNDRLRRVQRSLERSSGSRY